VVLPRKPGPHGLPQGVGRPKLASACAGGTVTFSAVCCVWCMSELRCAWFLPTQCVNLLRDVSIALHLLSNLLPRIGGSTVYVD
jgi:hypothetical protein